MQSCIVFLRPLGLRLEQGGVFVNDEKVPAPQFAVTEEMLKDGVKIRKGKKVFHKAVLQ